MAELLTMEETKKLLERWQYYHDQYAMTTLIEHNIGLVKKIANRYYRKGIEFDELVSEGTIALYRAIDKFNLDKPIRCFSSYVSSSIEREMWRYLNNISKEKEKEVHIVPLVEDEEGKELRNCKLNQLLSTDADEVVDKAINQVLIALMPKALECLSEKQKRVILIRYGFGDNISRSLSEVGDMLGQSKENISEIEQRALKTLRKFYHINKNDY